MDKQHLLTTLETLHAELISAEQVDDETQKQLQAVTDDIQRLLGKGNAISREEMEPVNASIRDLLLKFETEHPSLTSVLNRIASGCRIWEFKRLLCCT